MSAWAILRSQEDASSGVKRYGGNASRMGTYETHRTYGLRLKSPVGRVTPIRSSAPWRPDVDCRLLAPGSLS
jgi:hypothetical protein